MANTVPKKRFKIIPEMEGRQAHWYARQRGSGPQLAAYRARAAGIAGGLPPGAAVLEVAAGPGHLAVELARRGLVVSTVDVSRTMVEIGAERARAEGVTVAVQHGDAAALPYPDGSFDLVLCQAAFKNFTEPTRALNEMHRVLRPGGRAEIEDMSADASNADITAEVAGMELSPANRLITAAVLRFLRRRAYGRARLEDLAARSHFGGGTVTTQNIGITLTLTRS